MILKNQKGAALVEMAIVLPLLLLVVFGITEFGRAMFIYNTLNNAARMGARQASVLSSFNSDTVSSLTMASIPTAISSGVTVTVSPPTPVHGSSVITVVVTKPFTTVVPTLPGLGALSGITLTAEASMLYE